MLSLIPGLSPFPKINITLYNSPLYSKIISSKPLSKPYVLNSKSNKNENIYIDNDAISGEIEISLSKNNISTFEHAGLSIQLIGQIINHDKQVDEFLFISKDIDSQGIFDKDYNFGFSFKDIKLQYESYYGNLFEVRYFLKVILIKAFLGLKSVEECNISFYKYNSNYNPLERFKSNIKCELEAISSNIILSINELNVCLEDCISGSIKIISFPLKMVSGYVELVRKEYLISKTYYTILYIIFIN